MTDVMAPPGRLVYELYGKAEEDPISTIGGCSSILRVAWVFIILERADAVVVLNLSFASLLFSETSEITLLREPPRYLSILERVLLPRVIPIGSGAVM